MVGQLDDLDELCRRGSVPVGDEAVLLERLAVGVVELVAVPVPLVDQRRRRRPAAPGCRGPGRRARSPAASCRRAGGPTAGRPSGRSPGAGSSGRTRCCWRPPARARSGRTRSTAHCMPRQMPKNGMPLRPGVADRLDLALDPPHAEPARDEDAVDARRGSRSAPSPLDLLGLDPLDDHPGPVGDPGVVERLVDRLVGVAVLHVLADDGDPAPRASGCMIRSTSSRQSPMSSGLGLAGRAA